MADERLEALARHGWRERVRGHDLIEFYNDARPREWIAISTGELGWMHFESSEGGLRRLIGRSAYGVTLTKHLEPPPAQEA